MQLACRARLLQASGLIRDLREEKTGIRPEKAQLLED